MMNKADFEKYLKENKAHFSVKPPQNIVDWCNEFATDFAEKEYSRGYKAGRKYKSKKQDSEQIKCPEWINEHNRNF